ncbi:hydroxymethylbilane synthase [Arcobacter sp. FWKO B]|uniref:hydroxymethylbilane synthase n=1 Tax=Arcobacter sp. FWKO B TaxID=2593672 RepID=UPI0018A60F6A|nr:hydroxymethylbilane synthase [Arcobacter sp. FWKO B]QOG11948.1 hydroxymethylbilane synthase [Arcobacter sp. FWKO B]
MDKLVITTRASALALWQAYFVRDEIKKHYPSLEIELLEITSKGDKILDRPLALIGGKGHFTKELEDEMLAGNADLAVHSLKDVPSYIPDGLELVAITKRADQSDVFLSHKYKSLDELPMGAVVGTTSLRRRMQLLSIRPDLQVKDLRGNVNTRLRKLSDGEYDAIILAYIGLARLDLIKDVPYSQKLPLEFMIPPMGQASLGIEIVSNNPKLREIASVLNDNDSFLFAKLERDFVSKIGAGCSAPVAVNATIENDEVTIRAMIGFSDGTNILKHSLSASRQDCDDLGIKLANDMISQGALELLKASEAVSFKETRPQRL